ncbi:hypothetical protein IAT40_004571 [Kwoniella sp. CBS 6097]
MLSTSRSLSPSSPPFIFPRSSPTFTSRSNTTTHTSITSSSSSLNIESPSSSITTSHSLTPTASSQFREKGDFFPSITTLATSAAVSAPSSVTSTGGSPTKAKPFGAGWKSTSTSFTAQMKEINSFLPASESHQHQQQQDVSVCRSRSPSLPILPSQEQAFASSRQSAATAHRDLFPINTNPYIPHDFELYTPASPHTQGYLPFGAAHHDPYPISPTESITTSTLQRHPSISTIDIELDDHASPFPAYAHTPTPTGLLHHQSVPNLPFQQGLTRRPSGMSVHFREDVLDVPQGVESDGMQRSLRRKPGLNFGQLGVPRNKLTGSRSMPVIQMVGEGRNVFIHRVNANLSEDDLRKYASEFGDVVSVKIPTRTTKPHAFVMFKKPEQAQRFIVHLKMGNVDCEFGKEDYQVQNKALEDPNSANLYVAGLPVNMIYDELADLLSPGKICSWKPLVDEAGNRRGPVMARLQTRLQAEEVIRKLNGKYYPGMSEKLQVRIADSDEQKHFKRQQNVWRERVPPEEFGRHVVIPEQYSYELFDHHEDHQDQVPDLLKSREYLASQLQAIDQKLYGTTITPRAGPTPSIAFSHGEPVFDHPTCSDGMYDTPSSPTWEDHNHLRRASNDSWSEPWASGIIGPAPRKRAPVRWNLPLISPDASCTNDQTDSHSQSLHRAEKSVTPTHSRQQALSFGSLAQTQHELGLGPELGLGADLWAAASGLKNVKSSPELGGRGDRASKLD